MNTTLAAKVGGGVVLGSGAVAGGIIISKQSEVTKIKDKLNAENILTTENESDKDDWKIRAKQLKDYEESSDENALKLTEITETKQKLNGTDTDWTHLKDWCEVQYQVDYEENNLWKLVNKFCIKATIKDALFDTELPTAETLNTDWDSKVTKAKSDTDGEHTKDLTLKADLTAKTSNDETRAILQKWCSDQYQKRHNAKEPWGQANAQMSVLDEVKKFCVVLIKDKIEDAKKFTDWSENAEDTRWGTLVDTLNGHQESNNQPKLDKELVEIKKITESNNEKTKRKAALKKWCKETYEKGYKGSADNLWKLVEKFCYKS